MSARADFTRNHFHHAAILEGFRTDRVDGLARISFNAIHHGGRKIVNVDRLQPIASVPI